MCVVVVLGFIAPRVVLVLMWLTGYLADAYHTFIWPFLGFFFAPTTTIAYAIAINSLHGLHGWGLVLFILGILIDAGVFGGGRGLRPWRRWRDHAARRSAY